MDYFIADLHIGDKNILQYEHRPFKDIKEMEKVIIQNWNKTVTNEDTVYLLGDIGDINVISKLNGKIVIVCGNHDDYDKLKTTYPNLEIVNRPIMVGPLWLSHAPIGYMPPEIPYLNIHGHLHRFHYGLLNRKWEDGNRYFCVSVEQINYTPISTEEIKRLLEYE
jgi:calcineurin-like phosphoesterase family protein